MVSLSTGVVAGRADFENRVTELKEYFDGLLHSLECTQDCLDLPGSKLFHGSIKEAVFSVCDAHPRSTR